MNISLTPATQRLLEEEMARRGYRTADDAVRVALERMRQDETKFIEDLDPETQAAIEEGLAQAERGEGRPWEDVREEIRARFIK